MEGIGGLFVFVWIICGIAGFFMLFSRGVLNLTSGLLVMIFFGPLIFLFAICCGPITLAIAMSKKRCPHCRTSVSSKATICPSCKSAV